jgi:XTP/dITP diphosphohydrolase
VRLLLASRNEHKLRELAQLMPYELDPLPDGIVLPPETGTTFADNALGKARAAAAATGRPAIADDSGIEAAALGGRPGIHSARWSGAWVPRLLAELEGAEDRRARYVCSLVALGPGGEEVVVEGTLEGAIALEPRGSEGFGYDPIFVPEGETRTVAELGNAWKERHSHRARAAAALTRALRPPRRGGRGRATS